MVKGLRGDFPLRSFFLLHIVKNALGVYCYWPTFLHCYKRGDIFKILSSLLVGTNVIGGYLMKAFFFSFLLLIVGVVAPVFGNDNTCPMLAGEYNSCQSESDFSFYDYRIKKINIIEDWTEKMVKFKLESTLIMKADGKEETEKSTMIPNNETTYSTEEVENGLVATNAKTRYCREDKLFEDIESEAVIAESLPPFVIHQRIIHSKTKEGDLKIEVQMGQKDKESSEIEYTPFDVVTCKVKSE